MNRDNYLESNFKTHTLRLKPKYFELIKSGKKIFEGRLNDEKRREFNIGDHIIFYKEPERVETLESIILEKHIFKNFEEMAENIDKSELGFSAETKQQMIDVYRNIYTKDDEKKYGVVIFKIENIE